MVIASIVNMGTCTWRRLYQSHLSHGKKKIFSLWSQNFAIIFALFVSFGFWSHFLSFLFLPSLSFKVHGFMHESFEHLCCLTYIVMYQENNSLKKTLFNVFGLKLRILLHFPVGGSCSQIWHQAYEGFDGI